MAGATTDDVSNRASVSKRGTPRRRRIGRGRASSSTRDVAGAGAISRLAAGEATLLGLVERRRGACIWRLRAEEATASCSSSACRAPSAAFPPSARTHPPALRLERAIRDLYGLEPEGRPTRAPGSTTAAGACASRSATREPAPAAGDAYAFLAAEGPPLHQIPVGPVHAGIIEPGHFRFTANGETVVRLEERLGYVHKGIDGLMPARRWSRRRRLAGRVSGDSTVAYAIAFARAVEAALGIEPPPRAVWLRALMAELERLANHFGDIGAICNDASFSLMHAHCGILREHVLRVADACFGHRLMMDRVVPGGVAVDLDAERRAGAARRSSARSAAASPSWSSSTTAPPRCRTAPSPQASSRASWRASTAPAATSAAPRAAPSMRASTPGYPPYDDLRFEMPVRAGGRRRCPRVGAHRRGRARASR